jgi:hypothetical protein
MIRFMELRDERKKMIRRLKSQGAGRPNKKIGM